ncbi:MAG: ureidoglycolate lyase [Burkholderiaceae bacterium]
MQIEPLTDERFAPYGVVLGAPFPGSEPSSAFSNAGSDFWRVGTFDPGTDGQTEVLWVTYRNASLVVTALEVHWLTEQAIVPLRGGDLIHVVANTLPGATSLPDLKTLRAFRVESGQGVCMNPGCWHASFTANDEVLCQMLTRTSTTRELVSLLTNGEPARETTIVKVDPVTIR